jgi:uncharacterized membrane protein
MRSAARIGDHPIHPMLIPYPLAFLSSALAFDAAGVARNDDQLCQTARVLTKVGLASALAAAVPGLIDYVTRVPKGEPRQIATKHMISNLGALACFAGAALARGDRTRPGPAVLALEAVGTAALSLGGWLGGSLAYHHQVGVMPEERRDEWLEVGGRSHLLREDAIPMRA